MLRTYLWQGLKAGAVAGVVFGLFVALVGNPLVGMAESLGSNEGAVSETADGHAHEGHAGGETEGHAHGGETGGHGTVSAAVTSVVSVFGGLLWGLLLGVVVFGVAFFFLEPMFPGTGAVRSFVLAGAGFVTIAGAPWLVVPPLPGGVEPALSLDAQFLWFGLMAVAGAAASLGACWLYSRIVTTRHRAVAGTLALAPFALVGVLAILAPSGGAVTSADPFVRSYQGVVLFGQLALWATMASAHAWFSQREASTESVDGVPQPAD